MSRYIVGLDDYPRAPAVSDHEQHVDLLAWMMFYSRTMVDISLLLGQDSSPYSEAYERFQAQLQGIQLPPAPSQRHQRYPPWGTADLVLVVPVLFLPDYWSEEHQCYCDIDGRNPATGLFNLVCHKGYVRYRCRRCWTLENGF